MKTLNGTENFAIKFECLTNEYKVAVPHRAILLNNFTIGMSVSY